MGDSIIYQINGLEPDCFSNVSMPDTSTIANMRNVMCEIKQRFDSCPEEYTKGDYQAFVDAVSSAFITLYGRNGGGQGSCGVPAFGGIAMPWTRPIDEQVSMGYSVPSIYILNSPNTTYVYFTDDLGNPLTTEDTVNSITFALPHLIFDVETQQITFLYYTRLKLDLNINVPTISEDINVSLSDGKTLGKYGSGEVIPCAGWTIEQLIKDIAQENQSPIVSLTTTPSSGAQKLQYKEPLVSIDVTIHITVNTDINPENSCVSSLFYKRGADWIVVEEDFSDTEKSFTYDYGENDENTTFEFKLVTTDTQGMTTEAFSQVQFEDWINPTISLIEGNGELFFPVGGNEIDPIYPALAISNIENPQTYFPITPEDVFSVYRSINGGPFQLVQLNGHLIYDPPYTIVRCDETIIPNKQTVRYRAQIILDTNRVVFSNIVELTYASKSYVCSSISEIMTAAAIKSGLPNGEWALNQERTISNFSAGEGKYTYYIYPFETPLVSISMGEGSSTEIIGAFTRHPNITVTYNSGISVTYSVYRSNAKNAFTNNYLKFR